ncbi:uncharacterized protein VP01_10831g1, partial [Puccinia sorghi]
MPTLTTPAPAQPNPAPTPASNPMVIAKPQPFDGTRGAAAGRFKVVFAVLFMKDYTANWSQPYLEKVFNGEPVVFNDFLNDFRSSFVDHNRRHCAKVALRNLCQTGTVSAYTQDFNQNTPTM